MKKELLENFPKTIAPMVNMGLELGITYKEFDATIKQVFVEQAAKIIKNKGNKSTDAAVSIVSGLSRTYVTQVINHKIKANREWINIPARAIAAWVAQDLESTIPYSSKDDIPDFVTLARGVTLDKSPKVVLNELVRLKRVSVNNDEVTFITIDTDKKPPANKEDLLIDFTDNLQAHALAGVNDLINSSGTPFLEQAVKVDNIHKDSAEYLSKFGVDIWRKAYKQIINEAQPISDKEEKEEGKHRLTFGVYCYYE